MNDSGLPRILVLEPYFGGSHQAFLNDLANGLPAAFELLTLPARKWKWRMRLAAPYFADLLSRSPHGRCRYHCILCSTFVDVAALIALAPDWVKKVPIYTYFHENQFAYPVQVEDERDFHFALTNLTTALASRKIAFNSRFNRDSFLDGVTDLLRKSPDMKFINVEHGLRDKSTVLYPGIDFSLVDAAQAGNARKGGAPAIVWNHRWEHDKNPERFFRTLYDLDDQGVDFQLLVMGESFDRKPEIFAEGRRRLAHKIIHFGYVSARAEYCRLLTMGDVVVSTATHEFYGISVIEAVRAGCRPVLPKRLTYPELFPDQFLYEEERFPIQLISALGKGRLEKKEATMLTQRFSWQSQKEKFQRWLLD